MSDQNIKLLLLRYLLRPHLVGDTRRTRCAPRLLRRRWIMARAWKTYSQQLGTRIRQRRNSMTVVDTIQRSRQVFLQIIKRAKGKKTAAGEKKPSECPSRLRWAVLPPTSLCNLSIIFSVTSLIPLPPPLVYYLSKSISGEETGNSGALLLGSLWTSRYRPAQKGAMKVLCSYSTSIRQILPCTCVRPMDYLSPIKNS